MMCPRSVGKWFMVSIFFVATLVAGGADAPLADAAERMDRESIRTLLQQRVDVNAPQVDGMTALLWAAYKDDLGTVELLVRAGADVNMVNRYGVTALSLACTNGNVPMVELFLEAGADVNAALPGGETPLMTASRTGKLEAVKALLAGGADIHSTVRGQTALMWAAADGYSDVVEELIGAGADFRTRLDSGFTPLLFAVREGQIDVVKTLLKAGADVNDTIQRKDPKQRRGYGGRLARDRSSALHLAVENGHYEMGTVLLEAGADPNTDGTGYTALHAISRTRKPGGGDNNPSPEGSGSVTDIEFVKKLVEHGADVNARMTKRVRLGSTRLNEFGATPFMMASQTADVELMRTLVELGADPLATNVDNSTPLMVAAGLPTRSPGEDAGTPEEVLEAVQLLLELGNDINVVDDNGETAMHGAAYKNLPNVVKFLAENGADIEIWNNKNKHGWTPLTIARGYRFGNFKPSLITVDAIEEVMVAAGVRVPTEEEEMAEGSDPYRRRRQYTPTPAQRPPTPQQPTPQP